MKGASWVVLILGAWILVSPMTLHVPGMLADSNIVFGALAIVVSIWSLAVMPQNHWPAWAELAIALWILMSPWVLHLAGEEAPIFASNALSGAVMSIFAVTRFLSARPAYAPRF
jgi:hypothetical protein